MREWLDCHCHVLGGGPADVREMERVQREHYHRCTSNFLSVEAMGDAAQNALGIYWKLLNPAHYAFGGLHYRFSYDFGAEAARLSELGFDGLKMIENKPSQRKELGYAQNDPRYRCLYEYAEATGFPLLIHVNDPAENWDWDRCSDWAKAQGFFYGDGTYVSYDQVVEETLGMLKDYPKLRITLAHLFFMADNGPRLREILDRYPQVRLDLTAGTEMYYAFDAQPGFWRQFFLDYADRLLFGTDNCYPAVGEDRRIADEINSLEEDFLQRADRFPLWDRKIQGAALPEAVVSKITEENFRAFAGAAPKPLNREKAVYYLRDRLEDSRYHLQKMERETVLFVLNQLEH